MKFGYAVVNFAMIRREGYYYADKTRFISLLEDPRRGQRYVLFLRPRRFGKTTFVSMLEHYYDIARKDQFEALFSGLHVGQNPTAERNRFLVLTLDFSGMGLEQGVDALRSTMLHGLRRRLHSFFAYYASILPGQLAAWTPVAEEAGSPAELLGSFLEFLRLSPHPLYIMIDEYDKLVNDLIARGDHDAYKQLLAASGFIRMMYERIKIGTATVVERVFMTGISPVMLNDMASGFGIATNLSLSEDYHDLCGFSQPEVEFLAEQALQSGEYALEKDQLLVDLRRYYNGYRFSQERVDRLYNPTAVIHFLNGLRPPDRYPKQILEHNLRTDHQKLYTLLFTHDHQPRKEPIEQIQTLINGGSITGTLHTLFPLEQAYDEKFFPSYLYYLGLTTITGEDGNRILMAIPNLSIREIHGAILTYILQQAANIPADNNVVKGCIDAMAQEGELAPFLGWIDSQVLQKLSNRDLICLDERGLKMLMLAYLSLSPQYFPFSELEVNRGYTDLILALNRGYPARYSFLLELKYLKAEGQREAALRTAVETQFQQGEAQLRGYLADERLSSLRGPAGWKACTVVQIGTRALLYRELGKPTVTLRWDPARRSSPPKKERPARKKRH